MNNPPNPNPNPSATNPAIIPAPQPATLLLNNEIARRERLAARGRVQTGCDELDKRVLLGGFERGSVVGVSAEEEGVGLAIGLQTVAGLLATVPAARVMVVTTLPVAGLLPKLRAALVGRLAAIPREGMHGLQGGVKGCLERISIARVFDVEGLWEVLGELDEAVAAAEKGPLPQPAEQAGNKPEHVSPGPTKDQKQQRTEVLDSEDEGGLSSSESPPPPPSPHPKETTIPEQTTPSTVPDMILITHTSTLLNTLFTGRDKETAHNTTQLLATHLHALARSPSHGGPLIMLLNSTASPYSPNHPNDTTTSTAPPTDSDRAPKQLDPTLRSIFNAPATPQPGHNHNYYAFAAARRSKPSFGLVFSQMLDLHLLCTRVPRTERDVAALVENPGTVLAEGAYVWVVEVLLDEVGVYQEKGEGGGWDWGERRCREQRWAAVDVDGEGRVVDAVFE